MEVASAKGEKVDPIHLFEEDADTTNNAIFAAYYALTRPKA